MVRGDLAGTKGTSCTCCFLFSGWFCGFGGWALPWHFALGPQFPQVTGCRCFRTLTQCFDFPRNVLCRAGSPEQCYKS